MRTQRTQQNEAQYCVVYINILFSSAKSNCIAEKTRNAFTWHESAMSYVLSAVKRN